MAWLLKFWRWLFPPTIVYEPVLPEPAPEPVQPVEAPETPPIAPESEVDALPALSLLYEAKPFRVTQAWGVPYNLFRIERHHGIDIAHGINSRIRAPFDFSVVRTLWQPNGGGRVLTIVSQKEYASPFGAAHVQIDYLHLAEYVKTSGSGKAGELICIAGNTGYTTGPHTHIQPKWVRAVGDKWQELEVNNANGSFDPMPYYTGQYAADV